MNLKEKLSVLSKSSPYSVSTLRLGEPDEKLRLKNYLYITSAIDKDFTEALRTSSFGSILFLCGSSGDGKSEILTYLNYKNEFKGCKFHLDATHSRSQHGSAVDCLNQLFDDYNQKKYKLVIGINIGMMQKFLKHGADRHQIIKDYFKAFFENRHIKGFQVANAHFYDFECYPKIKFENQEIKSEFVEEFLTRLTSKEDSNPFWEAYLLDNKASLITAKNFRLLSEKSFQKGLIKLLGLIRLSDEQFLVPRTFVDFIYKIITTDDKNGLIGNLFKPLDNEISRRLVSHDPLDSRSQEIDNFLLSKSINDLDSETIDSLDFLNRQAGLDLSTEGQIRLSHVLSESLCDSHPNSLLVKEKRYSTLNNYLHVKRIFSERIANYDDEEWLIDFVEGQFWSAVSNYINKSIQADLDGYILVREIGDFFVCNKADVMLDLTHIESGTYKIQPPEFVTVPFLINNNRVEIDIDLKVLELAEALSRGFVPNKNVQSEFAKLDEFIRDVIKATSKSREVRVYKKDKSNELFAELTTNIRGYSLKGGTSWI